MENRYINFVQYCEHCDKDVVCRVVEKYELMNIFENEASILTRKAYCPHCNHEIWVGEFHDFNLSQREAAWRRLNGYLSINQLEELLVKYNIGKRPFSQAIGLGEQTFTNYLNGSIPKKASQQLLLRVYNDPKYYLELVEQNKAQLNEIALKKTLEAANKLLNRAESSQLFLYAAYIIAKCGDVTPLQLQKMLYYTQACFIIFYSRFAFADECEAWIHGPVYKNVYEKYKDYRYDAISSTAKIPNLKSEEEVILNLVIENFGRYSGKALEDFTHKELPWLKAREGLSENEPSTRVIDNNLIFEYFTDIKNKYNIISLPDIKVYISSFSKNFNIC